MRSQKRLNRQHRLPATHQLAAALLAALAPFAAGAATISVTSPDDSDTASIQTCTLRQAIMSMDVGGLVAGCHKTGAGFGVDDTITFAASAITGATTPGTVTLADSADPNGGLGGTLVVSAPHLTIDASAWRGNGAGQYADGVTIARPAGASSRFGILKDTAPAGGELELRGIALRNGYAFEPLCDGLPEGGGICMVAANLTMTDSRVSGNRAAYGGGGVASATGTLSLTRCTIDNNVGGEYGGGVFAGSGSVTVTASTISGNGDWYVTNGGGISAGGTLTVIDSAISGNIGKRGAGIQSSGTLTLTRSVVADNQSYYDAGGIRVFAGTATVTGSTITNNFARYNGAGIFVAGALTVTNSTIAGNSGYYNGGGIALYGDATLHLDHATLTQNGVSGTGGGIGVVRLFPGMPPWTGSATIEHSIVSGNTQGLGTTEIELGSAWSGSGNLISSPDAALGPLQGNGGPTPTILPGPGSAALDAIAPADCTQSADQRGLARPQGTGCDIGAVEVAPDLIFANGFDPAPG
jgi:hypothetical protein